MSYIGGMRFHQARLVPSIWIGLSVLNLLLSILRHRQHPYDALIYVQGTAWLVVICVLIFYFLTSWTYTESALLQQRAFWRRTVPYESITSVEQAPGHSREAAVIVYGSSKPLTYTQRITVAPNDFAGFLAELERRAPQATFHV